MTTTYVLTQESYMHRLFAAGAIALILLFSSDAFACQHDRDCPAASRCVRTWGQGQGFCERGVAPIEGDETRRIGDPSAPRRTEGQSCELTVDCVPGLVCAMQSNGDVRICSR